MSKVFLFIILCVFSFSSYCYGQQAKEDSVIHQLGFTRKSIKVENDTVHFLILASETELKKRKPLLLFLQGSSPRPILIYSNGEVFPPLPFPHSIFKPDYHIAIISKPGIPIYPDTITAQHTYLINGKVPGKYLENDNLYYYTKSATAVIKYLKAQPYIDQRRIVLFGHSQGYRIAVQTAAENKEVTHLIAASANPYSRFHGFITENRIKSLKDTANAQQYQKNIDSLYQDYQKILESKNAPGIYDSETYLHWYSFTEPSALQTLLKVSVPILIIYGSLDYGSIDNDRLPFEFARAGKKNLSVKPFLGLEHNFFEVKTNGRPNYQKYHWDKVARYVSEWLKEK